jgi:hypothetical protein
MDAISLAGRDGYREDRDGIIGFYTKLLLGIEPNAAWSDRLAQAFRPGKDSAPETIRKAVVLILAMPEAQWG